jgi:amidase
MRCIRPAAALTAPLLFSILAAAQTTPTSARPVAQSHGFSVVEAGIDDMQRAMRDGRVTSRELVRQYLARIGTYDSVLHAVLAVNPNALADAALLDRERARGHVRGPLHGIPVALKDNIQTMTMPTTGGALAFAGYVPPYEATLTANLRAAGAVIIAKTGMTELANWVAGDPTPMPTNYNAIGGFGFNPFDPRRDPRDETFDGRPALQTGGSSSGIGTNASFWAANVGTETSGSILSPSNQNMLVGIKPTVGRISRYGVIPITADQDTPGPMTRSVADAAIMLGVLEGRAPDPHDPATQTCAPPPGHNYTRFLRAGALKGARIGIPRAYFYDRITPPGETEPSGGLTPSQQIVMANAIAVLKAQGAVVIDPANIPSIIDGAEANNFLRWNICSGADFARGKDTGCAVGLKYGMKRDFNAWLSSLGPSAPVKTLTELRRWNMSHSRAGTLKYGQNNLDNSDEMDVDRDRPRYEADRAKDRRLAGTHGIDEVMTAERLDAILFPGSTGANISARVGYPTVIVPFGMVQNEPRTSPFPSGFDAKPAPYGVSFAGRACSEPRLIELAYAFERATKRRVMPPNLQQK